MPTQARANRTAIRRHALVDAAVDVFATKGVAAASVDDIVRAAGVAKGTFYLYFATKGDAVDAVAARMVEAVADRMASAADDPSRSPVQRLLAFGAAMRDVGMAAHERELIETFHRPENRALHDRISEGMLVRLAPTVARAIADGIEQGQFRPQDPLRAGTYVLACYGALHDVVRESAELPEALDELEAFILGALGFHRAHTA